MANTIEQLEKTIQVYQLEVKKLRTQNVELVGLLRQVRNESVEQGETRLRLGLFRSIETALRSAERQPNKEEL